MNHKGVAQERTLVVSTQWMYNADVQHAPTGVKELKWALPIAALKSIALSTDHEQPCVTLDFDERIVQALMDAQHQGAKRGDANMNHSFLFNDRVGRAKMVREIERLVYRTTGKRVAVTDDDASAAGGAAGAAAVAAAEAAAAAAAPIDASTVDLRGFLKKGTRYGWSVSRFVTFDHTGHIEWADSDERNAKKSRERVSAVAITSSDRREFTLQTSGKELQLTADTQAECERWVRSVQAVLDAR